MFHSIILTHRRTHVVGLQAQAQLLSLVKKQLSKPALTSSAPPAAINFGQFTILIRSTLRVVKEAASVVHGLLVGSSHVRIFESILPFSRHGIGAN